MQGSKLIAVMAAGLLLASCGTDRMDSVDTTMRPEPLEAQPVDKVEAGQLPDPTTDTSQFPTKPANDPTLANANTDQMAATALDVKKETMVGSWKVNANGVSCQMFLTLTNLGAGSRGGTRGCGNELSLMNSWEVAGKQVTVKDRDGNLIATFYKTAENQFSGRSNAGGQISLSR
ncbi:protease inhibitor Inh/omp19 family protein [Rhizobium sp.]